MSTAKELAEAEEELAGIGRALDVLAEAAELKKDGTMQMLFRELSGRLTGVMVRLELERKSLPHDPNASEPEERAARFVREVSERAGIDFWRLRKGIDASGAALLDAFYACRRLPEGPRKQATWSALQEYREAWERTDLAQRAMVAAWATEAAEQSVVPLSVANVLRGLQARDEEDKRRKK
jgi:hypothetical protein